MEQTPGNDIDDYEDLQSGGRAGGRRGGPRRAAGGAGTDPREGRVAQPFHRSAQDRRRTAGVDLGLQRNFREQAGLQRRSPSLREAGGPQRPSWR